MNSEIVEFGMAVVHMGVFAVAVITALSILAFVSAIEGIPNE